MSETPQTSAPPVPPVTAPIGAPKNVRMARLIIGLASPVGVGVVCVLGLLVMRSFNLMSYGPELVAAAIISVIAGFFAVLPLLVGIRSGAIAVVRLTMLAMILRMGLVLIGLVFACGPGWRLHPGPLVLWALACYIGLMIAESGATIWATRQ